MKRSKPHALNKLHQQKSVLQVVVVEDLCDFLNNSDILH